MGLKECLNYIKEPNMNVVPHDCRSDLRFPKFERITDINSNPSLLGFFYETFPKKIKILQRILIYPNLDFRVPKNLFQTNSKARYQLIPLIILHDDAISDEINKTTCYQALLRDLREDSWEVFSLPGSRCNPDRDTAIEQKLIKLLTVKLKLPVNVFYQNIRFRPGVGTEADLWWPSYLIYLKIQDVEKFREARVAFAFADLIQNSDNYKEFVENFKNYSV